MLTADEETSLINVWIKSRDDRLLARLIKAFEPLVLKYARLYAAYGIPKEELVAVGNLALVETANRFDPTKGLRFSTYSSHWIKGTMLVFIASNYFNFALKSQKMKHIFFTLRRVLHQEQKDNGTTETNEQIMCKMAERFGCSPQQLEEIYQMIRQPNISIHDPMRQADGEETTFGDTLFSNDPDPEELTVEHSMTGFHKNLIRDTMQLVLSEREQTIIKGQLLMDNDHERTLQDLANEFNLSRERVRQIRNTAYEKLESAIRDICADQDTKDIF